MILNEMLKGIQTALENVLWALFSCNVNASYVKKKQNSITVKLVSKSKIEVSRNMILIGIDMLLLLHGYDYNKTCLLQHYFYTLMMAILIKLILQIITKLN